MKYLIRADKVELTEAIKKYITEKLSRMDKYFENPEQIEARILITVKGIDQKVETTIRTQNYDLRVEEIHSDLYSAIDVMMDKLERQFRKFKTKLIDKKRREEVVNELEDFFEGETEQIVRRKEIFLKPIDEEEAITQLELLDHTFFIFKNVDTNKICVVYKRKDGNYGLLETNS